MLSPYLRRPLRSLTQAMADVARSGKRGRDLPPPLLSDEPAAASGTSGKSRAAGAVEAQPRRAAARARIQRH